MEFTSAFVQVRDRIDEIMYRRRLMHSEAAGIPTDQPMSNLVAEKKANEVDRGAKVNKIYSLISHQTGTRTIASCPQMIELIQLMDKPTAVQKMNKHVPVFQADKKCQLISYIQF
jgi:hypothetical protein